MANMRGFQEACDLIHENNLENHIGLHVVLDEGHPLTEDIRRLYRFCDGNGLFKRRRSGAYFWLTTEEQKCVYEEIAAQVKRARRHHIDLTHLDSHRHIHEEFPIVRIVLHIAADYAIQTVRSARNIGYQRSKVILAYRTAVNQLIMLKGKRRTRFMGSFSDFCYHAYRRNLSKITQSAELMVHPALDHNGQLVDDTPLLQTVPQGSLLMPPQEMMTMERIVEFWAAIDHMVL